jgi:hypothetical protein
MNPFVKIRRGTGSERWQDHVDDRWFQPLRTERRGKGLGTLAVIVALVAVFPVALVALFWVMSR